jgi:hypothetical protein
MGSNLRQISRFPASHRLRLALEIPKTIGNIFLIRPVLRISIYSRQSGFFFVCLGRNYNLAETETNETNFEYDNFAFTGGEF